LTNIISATCLAFCAYYYSQAVTVRQALSRVGHELNITGRGNPDMLIFNRVPKVGSQTIMNLIGYLRAANDFDAFTSLDNMPEYSKDSETVFLPDAPMRQLTVDSLMKTQNKGKSFAFLKHQNFLNFSEFNESPPIYMNFVRHPVERVISWYYYVRAPWYQIEHDKFNQTSLRMSLSIRELKTSLEDCLKMNRRGCIFEKGMLLHSGAHAMSHVSQMSFFCGHDRICNQWEQPELHRRAKENVEKYFAVVGVLEDWEISLEVLEQYIPRFFAQARKVAQDNPDIKHVNKNIYKPKVSTAIRHWLAAKMPLEIDFFHFCRQRLYQQYLAHP
ncbi:hypothetical protein TCAL_01963, partial [Tigriopus californicus]